MWGLAHNRIPQVQIWILNFSQYRSKPDSPKPKFCIILARQKGTNGGPYLLASWRPGKHSVIEDKHPSFKCHVSISIMFFTEWGRLLGVSLTNFSFLQPTTVNLPPGLPPSLPATDYPSEMLGPSIQNQSFTTDSFCQTNKLKSTRWKHKARSTPTNKQNLEKILAACFLRKKRNAWPHTAHHPFNPEPAPRQLLALLN